MFLSYLKHVLTLLDDVFELNFEQTHLVCMSCFDPVHPTHSQFDITDVEYGKLPARSQKFRNLSKGLKKHVQLESHKSKNQCDSNHCSEKSVEQN